MSEEIDLARAQREYRAALRGQVFGARSSFHEYCRWMRTTIYGEFLSNWWVRQLSREMELFYHAWITGDRPVLGICAPPQHGKSRNSEDVLGWFIGKHPGRKYLYASFSKELGERTNASIQRAMDSDPFRLAFSARLPPLGRSEGGLVRNSTHLSFDNRPGGEFRNTTVEGQVNGLGFDLMVLDDLIKGRAEARSKRVRDAAWEWLTDDVLTRRSKHCAILFTMTRWHVDDPMGRMQERFPGMRLLRYPALATEDDPDGSVKAGYRKVGEPLFPEHKPMEFIQDQKSVMTGPAFEALYQQNPSIEGGEVFPVERFVVVPSPTPKKDVRRYVRYWDKAGTHKGGAYTVGVLMALLRDDAFEVQDVIRGQWSALEREQRILQTAKSDDSDGRRVQIWLEQEPGSGGKESVERSISMLRGHAANADKVTGSKEIRAEPYAAQVQAGNVRLVAGTWNRSFIDEHELFPNGPYKDQVDAAGGAFAKLVEKPVFDYRNV